MLDDKKTDTKALVSLDAKAHLSFLGDKHLQVEVVYMAPNLFWTPTTLKLRLQAAT